MSCVSILKPDELEWATEKEHWSVRAVRWLNMSCFVRASQSLANLSAVWLQFSHIPVPKWISIKKQFALLIYEAICIEKEENGQFGWGALAAQTVYSAERAGNRQTSY